jgi:hypothetical protein
MRVKISPPALYLEVSKTYQTKAQLVHKL